MMNRLSVKTLLTQQLLIITIVLCGVTIALSTKQAKFNVVEATIADIHNAISNGTVTCEQVIQMHIERIYAYDQSGPKLNSVIAVNPDAINQARAHDQNGMKGSLFCIPVALKDNIDLPPMPTAAGSLALNQSIPLNAAVLAQRLIDAGAIIVARVNMAELAFDGFNSNSSLGGQTLNAYNVKLTPMGSSGGTGTAIAASFAVIGIGSDTNGSIQNPSNVQSLVGLRSSTGIISSVGVFPLLDWQDVAGPMTRTVEDLAKTMEVIDAGLTFGRPTVPYVKALDPKALKGARIGFLKHTIEVSTGTPPLNPDPEVVSNLKQAMDEMRSLGATVLEISPNTTWVNRYAMLNSMAPAALRCAYAEQRNSWDYYFQTSATPSSPVKSSQDLLNTLKAIPNEPPNIIETVGKIVEWANVGCTALQEKGCVQFKESHEQFGRFLEWALEYYRVDALMYPMMNQPAPPLGQLPPPYGFMTYSVLSAFTGMPAIVFQTGFTQSGTPLGAALLSHRYSEVRLVRYAYSYQANFPKRRAPTITPPL